MSGASLVSPILPCSLPPQGAPVASGTHLPVLSSNCTAPNRKIMRFYETKGVRMTDGLFQSTNGTTFFLSLTKSTFSSSLILYLG